MVQKFMVKKSRVEKFMVEKSAVERFGVEAWGRKVRGWDVLQPGFKGLDILVNNAGCAFTMQDPTPFAEQAQQSIDINYYGTKHMIETFLPLCNRNASFIGVSSTSGQLEGDTSKFAADKFPFYDHF